MCFFFVVECYVVETKCISPLRINSRWVGISGELNMLLQHCAPMVFVCGSAVLDILQGVV